MVSRNPRPRRPRSVARPHFMAQNYCGAVFTVDQVVHDYGDVCQAVTALAVEQSSTITVDEFRTLNRCLDNAIADAVASFGQARQFSLDRQSQTAQNSLATYLDSGRFMRRQLLRAARPNASCQRSPQRVSRFG